MALLLIPSFGHGQKQGQPLKLTLKSDKQAYSMDEPMRFLLAANNLSSEKIPILVQGKGSQFNFAVILDGKAYKNCSPGAWGGPDSLSPKSKINIAIELKGCGITKDRVTAGQHHMGIIFGLNQAVSNTLAFAVTEKQTKKADPIDRLADQLSSTRGAWINGSFPEINLPSTATTEQVVTAFFQTMKDAHGGVPSHKTLRVKEIQIPIGLPDPEQYAAALVQTKSGKKIVLVKFENKAVGWWTRLYDPVR